MEQIITRFPPSPTGYLHVGGARTAIFNWLYARKTGGKFVLRIEDTDAARSTQASVDAIFDGLEWLGIDWDEGPYFQTERFDLYRDHIQQLLETGHAYYCTCSPEQIEEMRKKGMADGGRAKYDGSCRDRGLGPSEDAVVRFRSPETGTTVLEDVIKGNIVFQNGELDDFVIARGDGTPTYNFVVVVDDMTMNINTILRGDDHVSNTPKQILLYKAFGHPLPLFGHLPMVLGQDKTRLSKRHGAMSVTAYREMGYLPDAMLNYLVRLGWSHGDQEFFKRDELIAKFSLENIGKSAGVFDLNKLQSLNADHLRALPPEELGTRLLPFMAEDGIEARNDGKLQAVVKTMVARSKTLREMADGARFFYSEEVVYEEKPARKFLKAAALEPLTVLVEGLEALELFDEKHLEAVFLETMEKTGLKLGKIAQPVRVALTGSSASPGIFEVIAILGREQTLKRLSAALAYIRSR